MKDAKQNEMDLLLRSFARGHGGALPHDSLDVLNVKSAHLDADELNAFAEGMLPERARTRHSEHLADCANCRSVVIKLSAAAGLAPGQKEVEQRSSTTFWHSVTAIFSQPVVRYALSAIVLASIVGVVFVALRQDEARDFVAQHQPSSQPANLNESNQSIPVGSPAQIETRSKDAAEPPPRSTTVPVEGPTGEAANTNLGRADAIPKSRTEAVAPPAETTPTFAPDVSVAAAPHPLPAYSTRDQVAPGSKEDSFQREGERARAEEHKLQTSSDASTSNRQAAAKSAAAPTTGGVQGLMSERRRYEPKTNKDSAADDESRTISGKRFIRKGNAWVDSAYSGSSATTNVKRGSEQYRALVADEPSIRTFADQLGGEVIVVWKGRAYRIR